MMWIWIIFVVLAAFFNAVMDKCSFHWYKSIFNNLNPYFWNAEVSWKSKYVNHDPDQGRRKLFWKINYPVQLTDAWHLSKTLMIFSVGFMLITYKQIVNLPVDLLIFGCVWNCTFSLSFNLFLTR